MYNCEDAKVGTGHNSFEKGFEKVGGTIAGKDMIDTTVEFGVKGSISIINGTTTSIPSG